jgi:predicted nucleic acid-binding Zn ribbon protein
MTRYRRSPRRLAVALDQARDGWAPATLLADVQRAWPTVVGSAIAAEANPTAERGGVLTVTCSASVWAQELDLMGPEILARLNTAIGSVRLTRLRCTAASASRR